MIIGIMLLGFATIVFGIWAIMTELARRPKDVLMLIIGLLTLVLGIMLFYIANMVNESERLMAVSDCVLSHTDYERACAHLGP